MIFDNPKPESDAIEQACEILEANQLQFETFDRGATKHLFQVKTGDNTGDFLKVYKDGALLSTARKMRLTKWPGPTTRAEAEIKASEYMREAGFETPKTERVNQNAVLLEYEEGTELQDAVNEASSIEAKRIGVELGACFAEMRENNWMDYDTNPANYLVRKPKDEYEVISIDNEMFRENVPEQVIDHNVTDIQENIRDDIIEGEEIPENLSSFVYGFSNAYGQELNLKSGFERVYRDTVDLIKH